MHYLVYDMHSVQVPLPDPQQLDAVERVFFAARGEIFLRQRALLRTELSRLIGQEPWQIKLTYSELGKPECALQPFNQSHSGDLLSIAFHDKAVGIDIERVRPRASMRKIARRFLSPEQWEIWNMHDCTEKEFYDSWCVAEALAKLDGGSILQASDHPFFMKDGQVRLLQDDGINVELFTPADGYCGAVAYRL